MDATSHINKLDLTNCKQKKLNAIRIFGKSEFKALGFPIFFNPELSIIPAISAPHAGINNPATYYFLYR